MNTERLRTQLEQILDTPFRIELIAASSWLNITGVRQASVKGIVLPGRYEQNGIIYFGVTVEGDHVRVLTADSGLMTDSEKQLVELVIEAFRSTGKKIHTGRSDDEQFATDLATWIEEQIRGGSTEELDPPQKLNTYPSLYTLKVPLLLFYDYSASTKNDYSDLKKLLESFFDSEIVLLPLMDKEWLILAPESLLSAGEDEDGSGESLEEAIASLCSGIHTVISNEWMGECHVSAYYPIIPAKSLPATVHRLREAIKIGRIGRMGQYIHLPWQLYLDQLLSPVPVSDKLNFIGHVFKRTDPLLDGETIQTLETFFDLDCNVSETAKKLFIHRNTLLYRLDKFRQETGLDVRSFNQAVHVRIALQLYKVTKRN
jgi:hypothetical protein